MSEPEKIEGRRVPVMIDLPYERVGEGCQSMHVQNNVMREQEEEERKKLFWRR
jgi:hypothetical protein